MKIFQKLKVVVFCVFVAANSWAATKSSIVSPLILSEKNGATPIVYAVSVDKTLQRATALWTSFFYERGCTAAAVVGNSKSVKLPGKGAVIAFETELACPLAKEIGLDLSDLKNARNESYVISTRLWKKRPLVLVVGKTTAGTEAGAWRLLSKVAYWNGTVSIEPNEEVNKPFFNIREMHLCARPDFYNWNTARLIDYPRYLKASGFNSVQIMEILTYWGYQVGQDKSGWTRERVAPVIRTIAKSAHAQGMSVSQFVWGEELLADKTMIHVLAKTYADEVDHLITHWGDPGPGGYAVAQRTTVDMLNEYRKINAKCQATVSTWYNQSFWDEKRAKSEGAKQFLDETFSSKEEIGIGLHRWWDDKGASEGKNPQRAELVLQSGRRLGIWGWYLSDYEMTPGEHLRARLLHKYFSSLPDEVSIKVDWISTEKIFHGGESRINQYIAGQMMWNPRKSIRDIMMDFCLAVYGPKYANAMCDAYECAEAIQRQYIRGCIPPEFDLFPVVGDNPEFASRINKVLDELSKIQLPSDWKPNIPDIGSPSDDIKVLIHRLKQKDGGVKYEGMKYEGAPLVTL